MKGVSNRNFKGFMVDSAQANWKVIRIMYGSEPMVDKERMCYFHQIQFMDRQTKQQIKLKM